MRGILLFAVVLGLSGCTDGSTPEPKAAPAPVEPGPAAQTTPPPTAPEPNDETTGAPSPTPEPGKREIIRMRCKPNYTPCYGGRECCNDLLEVCGKDNHCHPLE